MPPYQVYPQLADETRRHDGQSTTVSPASSTSPGPITLPPISSVSRDYRRPLPSIPTPNLSLPPMTLPPVTHRSMQISPKPNSHGPPPLPSPNTFYAANHEYNVHKTPSYSRHPDSHPYNNAYGHRTLGRSVSTPNPPSAFSVEHYPRTLPPLHFDTPTLTRSSPADHPSSDLVTPYTARKRKPEELYTPTTPPEDVHYSIVTPHGTIETGGILPPQVYEGEYPEAFISGDRLPSLDEKEGQGDSTKKSTPTTSSVNPWDYQRTSATARCKFSTKELWAMNIVYKRLNKKPPVVERQRLAAWFGKFTKHVSIWFQNARQSETKVQSTPDSRPASELKSRASAKPTQFDFESQGPTQTQVNAINAILKGRLSRDDFFNQVHVEGAAIKSKQQPQLSDSGTLEALLRAQELPRRHGHIEVKKMDTGFDIANMLSDFTSSSPPGYEEDVFDDDLPASKRRRLVQETPCKPRKGENAQALGDGRATTSLLIAASSRARNLNVPAPASMGGHAGSDASVLADKPLLPIVVPRPIRPSASFRLRDSYTRTQSENDATGFAPSRRAIPKSKTKLPVSVSLSDTSSEETDSSVLDAASSLMAMFATQSDNASTGSSQA